MRKNDEQWRKHSKTISRELRNLVNSAPPGQVMKSIVAEQVKYIKSLPLEAADRVYDIQNRAIEAVVTGGRAEHFAKEIAASGDIAKSRADLIARTELGRATGALDQARVRCQLVRMVISGVQPKMVTSGILIRKWKVNLSNGAKPPTLDGMTGHAGELPNCRCYKEIVFPTFHSYPA
ncbi:phage head morphogenesis protein [Escherichia coli]|nr:phage head morphogenesis protein [Escherichia coli]